MPPLVFAALVVPRLPALVLALPDRARQPCRVRPLLWEPPLVSLRRPVLPRRVMRLPVPLCQLARLPVPVPVPLCRVARLPVPLPLCRVARLPGPELMPPRRGPLPPPPQPVLAALLRLTTPRGQAPH